MISSPGKNLSIFSLMISLIDTSVVSIPPSTSIHLGLFAGILILANISSSVSGILNLIAKDLLLLEINGKGCDSSTASGVTIGYNWLSK